MPVKKNDEKSLLKIMIIVMVLASLFLLTSKLTVLHGVLLIAAYIAGVYYLKNTGLIEKIVKEEEKEAEEELKGEALAGKWATSMKLLGSLAIVTLGAKITVDSAVNLGIAFNAPLETIGTTIVALGTTLPELTLEINAVKKKEYALALGNAFGSTLVNLTLILGLLSLMSPTSLNIIPLLGTIIYFILIVGFIWYTTRKQHQFETRHGVLLVLLFVLYILEEIGLAGMF